MKRVVILLILLLALPAHGTTRSLLAKREFARTHTCPSTHRNALPCPGYVIDHIIPLDCGGRDLPLNMQYQTIAAARAKDKWERNGPTCKHRTHAKVEG